jgi:hypothetical protein
MLAALALALSLQPGAASSQPQAADEPVEVSELVVIASRIAPDPSDVTTECVWRNLPAPEREALAREVGRTAATLHLKRPHRPDPSAVTEAGVEAGLKACGAPADEAALPFARTAVRFYVLEQIASDALAARGLGAARLDAAWAALPAADRELLAAQAGRAARGSDGEAEDAARIVLDLLRRVRPLSAFNPLAYRPGGTNHLLVAHYAPRAVRHAMEKRF